RSARAALAERVDAIIGRRLRRPPTLAEIARELGMSESSLSHRFKRDTGLSVMERSRALRIEAARAMLLRDGTSVKSAARQLGFSSAFHLSRVFTELCGLPPMEWRRRHGGG
nr:helix-turn-helix transcriptional regulator [Planctomycetota bacterium]